MRHLALRRSSLVLCCPIVLLGAFEARASTVVFVETEFSPLEWQASVVHGLGAGGDAVGTQHPSGNPGPSWQASHALPDPPGNEQNVLWAFHEGSPHTYDPSTEGAIDFLRVEIDAQTISDSGLGLGQTVHGVAFRQDGVVFYPMDFGQATGNPPTGWLPHVWELDAADFVDVQGGPALPDFSSGGAPIEFGFMTSNATAPGGPARTTVVRYDNWSLTVFRLTAVPSVSPVGGAVLAGLLAGVGGLSARRISGSRATP